MSPHVGGYTRRAVERSVEEAVENLRRFLTAGELLNEVDLTAGY
jgi:phosphoglycerate dehydrogenase-like enzyme